MAVVTKKWLLTSNSQDGLCDILLKKQEELLKYYQKKTSSLNALFHHEAYANPQSEQPFKGKNFSGKKGQCGIFWTIMFQKFIFPL